MHPLREAIQTIPPGRYAVAVSAGADSTAMARLMMDRTDCEIVLVHLNHELRGIASDGDAKFVEHVAKQIGVRCFIGLRSVLEPSIENLPTNPSAKYRLLRLTWFERVVDEHRLDGVILAHHADDQAESVLLRLLRGGGVSSLTGILPLQTMNGLRLFRPLLNVRSAALREYLRSIGQSWREDATNSSPVYRRNVIRRLLKNDPLLTPLLIAFAGAARRLRDALDETSPSLAERFMCRELDAPALLAEHAARRWLVARGAPRDDVSAVTCLRLIRQALDGRQSPRQHYPGGILVRRRQKCIDVMPSLTLQSARSNGKDETTSAAEF